MYYIIIEEQDGFLLLRQPTEEEVRVIQSADTDNLVWVLIDGSLHADIGRPGFARLLGRIGAHIAFDDARKFFEKLTSFYLKQNTLFVRGARSGFEVSINDNTFPVGQTFGDAAAVANAVLIQPDASSEPKP